MSTCLMHDLIQKQRIPHITEPNTASEAICKLPTDVPGIAPFNIQAVYQFTDEEYYMDLYPTYTDIEKTSTGVTATKSDECLDEIDTAMDRFTWVSWIESVDGNQGDRKWIIYALLCTPTGDLSDDPDFKRPAVPFRPGGVNMVVPFGQVVEDHNVYVSSVTVDLGDKIVSYDITYPESWTPPWEDYVPPWEDYVPPWDGYEPPSFEIPSVPDYYYEAPPEIDDIQPPPWYSKAPEWFSIDPYPPPDMNKNTQDFSNRVCNKFHMRNNMLVRYEKSGCVINIQLDEDRLMDLLCRQFITRSGGGLSGGMNGEVVIGTKCSGLGLDLRRLFSAGDAPIGGESNCKSLVLKYSTDGNVDHTKIGIRPIELLGVDELLQWLSVKRDGDCKITIFMDLSKVGSGILTWGEDDKLSTTPIETDKYLTYQNGKVVWIEKAECEHSG